MQVRLQHPVNTVPQVMIPVSLIKYSVGIIFNILCFIMQINPHIAPNEGMRIMNPHPGILYCTEIIRFNIF